MNIALILAGGKGTRMMRDIPKQFVDINGKPIIVHTLQKFCECSEIDMIYVVCIETHMKLMDKICKQYHINKVKNIIIGGSSRHKSILNGIKAAKNDGCGGEDKIIIHNANMPLVSEENIINCIKLCDNIDSVVTSVARNTGYFYSYNSKSNKLGIGPDRKNILSAKVPEAMFIDMAFKLYSDKKFMEKEYESYTAGMLGVITGKKVIPVVCETTNIKITTEDDYKLVRTYLKNSNK